MLAHDPSLQFHSAARTGCALPRVDVLHGADTAERYQERIAAERKAREEAAQDVIFGLVTDAPLQG